MEKSSSALRQVCEGENNQQFQWINEGGDSLGSYWVDPNQPIFQYTLFWGKVGFVQAFYFFVYPGLEPGNCVSWNLCPFEAGFKTG